MNKENSTEKTQMQSLMEKAANWLSPGEVEDLLQGQGLSAGARTVRRWLAELAQGGVLEQRGEGRARKYRYNSVSAWFNIPPHERPPVAYDPKRVNSYAPGKTFWLSEEQKARLWKSQPPQIEGGSYAMAVAEKLMVDLSYASSSLEGNTYNYLDTETLLKYGQVAQGKEESETAMILNHKEAVNYLVQIAQESDPIHKRTLCELHSLLGNGLIDPRELGALRKRRVAIGGSSYVPLDVPSQLDEALILLIDKANSIEDPFEQSLFWMVQVAYLQPFIDINKRTGRLACNIPLLRAGLAPLSFMSMDKSQYVRGLLEFYELGSTRTIAQAFEEAYVQSAHRYEVHLTRDPAQAQLDRAYKQELAGIVREWVKAVGNDDPEKWEDIVQSKLAHVQDTGIATRVEERARELMDGLNEANRILYGLSIDEYNNFLHRTPPARSTFKLR